MNYVLRAPCASTGAIQATYDVRWHVDIVGATEGTPTNTYLVTVGAKRLGSTSKRNSGLVPSLNACHGGELNGLTTNSKAVVVFLSSN